MSVLILGIALFLGFHIFTTFRPARARLIGRLGRVDPGLHRALYSPVAITGLALIVWGFARYRTV